MYCFVQTKVIRESITSSSTQYIRHGLPDKYGVRTNSKEKYEVTEIDLDNLTATLWRNNDCKFKHERIRVQLTLLLLLHAYSGARAGTFLESGHYYKNSGRCLKYKVSDSSFYHNVAEKMNRTYGCTSIIARMEVLAGCSRSLCDILRPILILMITRQSKIPYFCYTC